MWAKQQGSHVILYSEIGASLTWLVVDEAIRTLETGKADIQTHGTKNLPQLKPNSLFCTTFKGSNEGIPKPLVPCLNLSTSDAMSDEIDESLPLKDRLHAVW